jgi:hypothetical protein
MVPLWVRGSIEADRCKSVEDRILIGFEGGGSVALALVADKDAAAMTEGSC